MAGPLEGIRVVEFAGYLSAPGAGYMLGDLGAGVVKVEDRVAGDPVRGMTAYLGTGLVVGNDVNVFWETANRNKKSITLDLKTDKGKKILYQLVEKADVFITNYSRRVCEKLGTDYETLKKQNPRLVYAEATGYGSRGPEAGKRGFDPIAQARSGMMYSVGEPPAPAPPILGAVFDQLTGTILAYGILAALVSRGRSGTGQRIEVSLIGAGIHIQAYNINAALLRGRAPARATRAKLKNPLSNYFECADGKWIIFSEAQSDRFWHAYCVALGIEHLETNPHFSNADSRRKNNLELLEILDKIFKTKTREEWIPILEKSNIAFSPILDPVEVGNDPQALANDYIVEVDHPSLGKTKLIGIPVEFSDTPAHVTTGGAPGFGEHTEDVLVNDLGYSWEEIEKLHDEKVI